MKPIRVLLLAESPYVGGITSHLLSVMDAFSEENAFDVRLATFLGRTGDATLHTAAAARGYAVDVLPMPWAFDPRVLRRLRKYVANHKIDIVHAHNYRATLLCAAGRLPARLVTTFHGVIVEPTLRLRFWQWLERLNLRRQPAPIACSEFARGQLAKQGVSPDRVRVVHNACASPSQGEQRRLKSDEDSLVVLYVGRLAPGKGLETLLGAVAIEGSCTVIFVGGGPLRGQLESLANELGVNAVFPGIVAEPGPYFASADVVALPSKMEALPMCLIEAAAHGVPAIVTRVGGIPEIVEQGENGLFSEYGDSASLAASLNAMKDKPNRLRMGQRASEIWKKKFSLDRLRDELGSVYRACVETTPQS